MKRILLFIALTALCLAQPAFATSVATDTQNVAGPLKSLLHLFTSGANAGRTVVPTVLYDADGNPIDGTHAVVSFQQTCTTSAVALPSNSYSNGFVILALTSNTGTVYVGGPGVTASTGYPLIAGQPISYGAANSNQAYIFCTNATDKVAGTGN